MSDTTTLPVTQDEAVSIVKRWAAWIEDVSREMGAIEGSGPTMLRQDRDKVLSAIASSTPPKDVEERARQAFIDVLGIIQSQGPGSDGHKAEEDCIRIIAALSTPTSSGAAWQPFETAPMYDPVLVSDGDVQVAYAAQEPTDYHATYWATHYGDSIDFEPLFWSKVPTPTSIGEGLDQANRDCLAKRKPGEPLFIILGRDPDGGNIVRLWAERRNAAGDADHAGPVFAIAEAMDAWASDPANAPESAPAKAAYAPIGEGLERQVIRAEAFEEAAKIADTVASQCRHDELRMTVDGDAPEAEAMAAGGNIEAKRIAKLIREHLSSPPSEGINQ